MKINSLVGVLAAGILLAGCSHGHSTRYEEQDFKPYVVAQQQVAPAAYSQKWVYPNGTPTQDIVAKWKKADLIKDVRTNRSGTTMTIGAQFYNLSFSGQRGLADAVAEMYQLKTYMVKDRLTNKIVGTYTAQGLQLY